MFANYNQPGKIFDVNYFISIIVFGGVSPSIFVQRVSKHATNRVKRRKSWKFLFKKKILQNLRLQINHVAVRPWNDVGTLELSTCWVLVILVQSHVTLCLRSPRARREGNFPFKKLLILQLKSKVYIVYLFAKELKPTLEWRRA